MKGNGRGCPRQGPSKDIEVMPADFRRRLGNVRISRKTDQSRSSMDFVQNPSTPILTNVCLGKIGLRESAS